MESRKTELIWSPGLLKVFLSLNILFRLPHFQQICKNYLKGNGNKELFPESI